MLYFGIFERDRLPPLENVTRDILSHQLLSHQHVSMASGRLGRLGFDRVRWRRKGSSRGRGWRRSPTMPRPAHPRSPRRRVPRERPRHGAERPSTARGRPSLALLEQTRRVAASDEPARHRERSDAEEPNGRRACNLLGLQRVTYGARRTEERSHARALQAVQEGDRV